jgi:hypothetical protein
MQNHINKEICTVSLVFPLFCPTPVNETKIKYYGLKNIHRTKISMLHNKYMYNLYVKHCMYDVYFTNTERKKYLTAL